MELAGIVHAAARDGGGAATEADVEAWGVAHLRPPGCLDEPVWPPPRPPLATGHVLFGYQPWHFPRAAAAGVRLSVHDGTVERLPAVGRPGTPVLFVEPATHVDLLWPASPSLSLFV